MKLYSLMLLLAAGVFSLHAALPDGAQVIEAESLKAESGWQVKKHFTGWYGGRPSGNYFLAGPSRKAGTAVTQLKLPTAGGYHLWIRYLDTDKYPGSFVVTVRQNGKYIPDEKIHDRLSFGR